MNFSIKKICCIGAGDVGGPTMSVLAEKCVDIEINVVDKNPERIKYWNSDNLKNLPIYEPGLEELVLKNYKNKRLNFSTDLNDSVKKSDIIFICVGTPTKKGGSNADLSQVYNVAKDIRKSINKFKIIITKSTVPVTTGDEIEKIIRKKKHKI